jgi:hypothetical protein
VRAVWGSVAAGRLQWEGQGGGQEQGWGLAVVLQHGGWLQRGQGQGQGQGWESALAGQSQQARMRATRVIQCARAAFIEPLHGAHRFCAPGHQCYTGHWRSSLLACDVVLCFPVVLSQGAMQRACGSLEVLTCLRWCQWCTGDGART